MTDPQITSRWPFLRTNPAGIPVDGAVSILTAIISVLILGPMIGSALIMLGGLIGDSPAYSTVSTPLTTIGIMLTISFFVSWVVLIGAIPIALACAVHGYAGWGVALGAGLFTGTLTTLVLENRLSLEVWGSFTATAVILAMVCWTSIRIFHPRFIGIAKKSLV